MLFKTELMNNTHMFTWSAVITFFTSDPLVGTNYKLTPYNRIKQSLFISVWVSPVRLKKTFRSVPLELFQNDEGANMIT